MFLSDHSLEPGSSDLLAELGIDPLTVREAIEHDRAMRCPDRDAVFSAYGFASLAPEPPFGHTLHEAAPPDRCPGQALEPRDPASSFPPA